VWEGEAIGIALEPVVVVVVVEDGIL